MAEKYDVAARLAEGQPSVDDVQTYVWACHMLGYADPDLTLHAAQVRDWYGTEDGLDLRALDADCAALEAAVAATEDALARQDIVALSAAWQGDGADASQAFLRRHGEASAAAAAAVRTSADALAALRDNLWQTVDGKVSAAIAAAGRAPKDWLAAAHTVTTGAGDRAAASERIDHEVKPFVDNDIRDGWLTAMRSAMAAVTDLYDAATAELTAEADAVFQVPGDLGPSWTPPPRDEDAVTVPAAASVVAPPVGALPLWNASGAPPPAPAPAVPPPMPAPAPAPPVDAASTAPAMAAPPSMPSLGGMPEIGSGLSGFGQQLADAFGSLLGSADDTLDTPGIDDPKIDDGLDDDPENDDSEDDESVDPAADVNGSPAEEEPGEEAVPKPACEPADTPIEPPPPVEPAPTPVPEPSPDPAPPAEPAAPEPVAAETPCEIAADELPQVGE
ncbi:hypothetical protein Mycsm_01096 [Mycobacterium sp. JS623]|uniref:hypothetical protein n=1 Tax=Mycobacterium sp. JS623 TaxID=212767 RepID=UPI0002A58594|nr:hypothetical protein [Mycobacterium sp. JS623]AGB21519.1 hypothetical protein Mycsm_01096 [Mycobacterium sp. JS623]